MTDVDPTHSVPTADRQVARCPLERSEKIMRLFDWNARRAGGRITITGKDSGGDPAKIVGVDTISPHAGRVYAIDKDGEQHELVLS